MKPILISVDERQFAMILASLRNTQLEQSSGQDALNHRFIEHFAGLPGMDPDKSDYKPVTPLEIGKLCETLNCGDQTEVVTELVEAIRELMSVEGGEPDDGVPAQKAVWKRAHKALTKADKLTSTE